VEIGKYVKLTKHLTLSFSVRQPHRWLTAAVFLKVVTDRNVCWCLLLTCTVCWCLLLNCTHLRHGSALLYCTVGVCYCECGSASVPVTAVSWMLSVSTQALHAALYRSIYSVLTWSCLGTLQGFLVCYCECGSVSVPVTAVSWMLSVSTQTLHAVLYRSIYSLLTWSCLGTLQGCLVCYCECGSPSVAVTAISWMLSVLAQTLHGALYRSIYSLLTWSCLGTLQEILGSFSKFWIVTIRIIISDDPSVCLHGTTLLPLQEF